jgi:quercetin dioxygenase-like cupin family protein
MPIKKIDEFKKQLVNGMIMLSGDIPQMSAAYIEFPAGKIVKPHTHDRVEAYLVLKGRAKMMAGDEIKMVTTGDLLIAPIGTPHGIEVLGDEPFVFYAFNAPPAATCPAIDAPEDVQKKFVDAKV